MSRDHSQLRTMVLTAADLDDPEATAGYTPGDTFRAFVTGKPGDTYWVHQNPNCTAHGGGDRHLDLDPANCARHEGTDMNPCPTCCSRDTIWSFVRWSQWRDVTETTDRLRAGEVEIAHRMLDLAVQRRHLDGHTPTEVWFHLLELARPRNGRAQPRGTRVLGDTPTIIITHEAFPGTLSPAGDFTHSANKALVASEAHRWCNLGAGSLVVAYNTWEDHDPARVELAMRLAATQLPDQRATMCSTPDHEHDPEIWAEWQNLWDIAGELHERTAA